MRRTDTIVIGAGQAGLSLSHHLTRARQPHVVLERGRIGERWHSERWDSLALLTPNWLNRLDGGAAHADRDGFVGRAEFAEYLRAYARAGRTYVHEHVAVAAVTPWRGEFHIATDAGAWRARNVVVATGDAAEPSIPAAAAGAPSWLRQLHSSRYRNPAGLPPGGVLVVGAGPSGQQIAAELRRAGRDVVLAAGRHARSVRRYRGLDIWAWLERLGDLERRIDEYPDPVAARRAPHLTLSGANGGEQLDLGVLHRLGVTIAGRLERLQDGTARFGCELDDAVVAADRRLYRLLDRIDAHVDASLPAWPHDRDHPAPLRLPPGPATIELAGRAIGTAIWATGYRRGYPWLHAPVLDGGGELVHRHGITDLPGLHALGLKFQRRRASHFIGGVGADAAFLARTITGRAQRTATAPTSIVSARPARAAT